MNGNKEMKVKFANANKISDGNKNKVLAITLIIAGLSIISVLMSVPALAKESTNVSLNAGSNSSANISESGFGIPVSSPFYFVQSVLDHIRIMLASGPQQKANIATEIAGKKLGQAIYYSNEGNSQSAKKAAKEYMKYLNITISNAKKISEAGDNASALNSLIAISKVQNNLEAHAIEVLQSKSNSPVIKSLGQDTSAASTSLDSKKNNIKIRYSLESNNSLKDAESIVQQANLNSGLDKGREERSTLEDNRNSGEKAQNNNGIIANDNINRPNKDSQETSKSEGKPSNEESDEESGNSSSENTIEVRKNLTIKASENTSASISAKSNVTVPKITENASSGITEAANTQVSKEPGSSITGKTAGTVKGLALQ